MIKNQKSNKTLFFLAILLAIISLFSIGFLLGSIYQSHLDKKEECGVSDETHTIKIGKTSFTPAFVDAVRCDKLTFYNEDDKLHGIVFGTFENHEPYGEFAQEYLKAKERVTIKLFKAGAFPFHDHLHEEIKGQLNIKEENK